jgi:hypothetical protein
MNAKKQDGRAVAALRAYIVEKLDEVNDDFSQTHVGINPFAGYSDDEYSKVATAVALHCDHYPSKTITEAARVVFYKLLDFQRKRRGQWLIRPTTRCAIGRESTGRTASMKLLTACAVLALLASADVAQPRPMTESDLLNNFIYYMAFGGLLQNKCHGLMINPKIANNLAIINRVAERDLMPGGKYFKRFAKEADKYADMVRGFNEQGACTTAIMAFGPEGMDYPNFMVPKPKE